MSTADHPSEQMLAAYAAGRTPPAAAAAVERHLAGCADCQQRVWVLTSGPSKWGRRVWAAAFLTAAVAGVVGAYYTVTAFKPDPQPAVVEQPKETPPAPDRLFQKGTVWKGTSRPKRAGEKAAARPGGKTAGALTMTVTVLDRTGETANLKVEVGPNSYTVTAKVSNGRLSWDGRETTTKGGPVVNGHTGTIDGESISLTYSGRVGPKGVAIEGEVALTRSAE